MLDVCERTALQQLAKRELAGAHLVEETWSAMRTTGIEDLVEN